MGWGVAVQSGGYTVKHPVDVAEYFVVPKPYDSIAGAFEPGRSLTVGACGMLPSVHLNDQSAIVANEISHVIADWNLSAEAKPT